MRLGGKIQQMGHEQQIQAARLERQLGRMADDLGLRPAFGRATLPGNTVARQKIQLRQTHLNSMKSENIGHRAIEKVLLLLQQVLTQFARVQPRGKRLHH